MDQMALVITDTIESLLEEGWEPPIVLVSVAANGRTMVARYVIGNDGIEAELLAASPNDGAAPALPINLFFVSSRGDAARVVLETPGLEPND